MHADPARILGVIVRAEAASASHAWSAAVDLWGACVELNPLDGTMWVSLGEAHKQLKDHHSALTAFTHAFALRAGHPADTALQISRCYAGLEDTASTLDWLQRASKLGLRSLKGVRDSPDFVFLHDDPVFCELVGITREPVFNRNSGWLHDLHFLRREIDRIAYDPYRLIPKQTFDERVTEIEKKIPLLSDLQILLEFQQLLGLLGDGHAGVYPAPEHEQHRLSLPIQFYWFEEGIYIIAASPEHRNLLGQELVQIGDYPIAEICTRLEPLICRDNDYWLKQAIPHRLRETPVLHAMGLIPESDRALLNLRSADGNTSSLEVASDSSYPRALLQRHHFRPGTWISLLEASGRELPICLKHQALDYWFQRLPDQRTLYMQMNRVQNHPAESFDAFTQRLFDTAEQDAIDRLVIDLRWNPGGNTYLEFPFLRRLIGSKQFNRPGNLYVIIGRGVFSAAQNFATLIERHTDAIFVGEPTGSSPTFVGETIEFPLPYSGAIANISDLLWQSGWPDDHRPWIAPRIFIPPTFADYQIGRDAALEAILTIRDHLPGM